MTGAITIKDLAGPGAWWCAGCGDAGVATALKREVLHLVNDLGVPIENIVLVSGIGCSSKTPEEFHLNSIHTQHGELVAVAIGLALARPDLTIMGIGGDGDGYGIGMSRFVHATLRNLNFVYIVDNNQVYGLTKGQASQTAHLGLRTISTPEGSRFRTLEPLELALVNGAAYVARGVSWTPNPLAVMIDNAINTRGFALLDVFSPCVTYHREPDFPRGGNARLLVDWYKQNYTIDVNEVYRRTLLAKGGALTDEEIDGMIVPDYDPGEPDARIKALDLIQKARALNKYVVGELLRDNSWPTMQDNLGVSPDRPVGLVDICDPRRKEDCAKLLAKFN